MTQRSNVFRNIEPLPKHRVSALLAAGWARVIARVGKGAFADQAQTTTRTVDNALSSQTIPELHTTLNSLVCDPSALDELFAGYGLRVVQLHAAAANDFHTAAELAKAAGTFIDALADGNRCHLETLSLGAIFRELLPKIQAIVNEADAIRTGAAA